MKEAWLQSSVCAAGYLALSLVRDDLTLPLFALAVAIAHVAVPCAVFSLDLSF